MAEGGGAAAGATASPAAASTVLAPLLRGAPRPAHVLGAGRAAVYLGVDGAGGEPAVVAVVAAGAVRLPIAVALAGPIPPAALTARDAAVGGGGVTLGTWRVEAVRWIDPRPRLGGPLQPRLVDAAVTRLAGLSEAATGVPPGVAGDVAAGLAEGDPGPALRLVGRGPGLTPAGDDVVAGALACLALQGALHGGAATVVLRHAGDATTALSAALLRCAAAGQVVPQAAAVLHALTGRGSLDTALAGLLLVGATSGAALSLGLVAGAGVALHPLTEDCR